MTKQIESDNFLTGKFMASLIFQSFSIPETEAVALKSNFIWLHRSYIVQVLRFFPSLPFTLFHPLYSGLNARVCVCHRCWRYIN